jgi:hypothetical protein
MGSADSTEFLQDGTNLKMMLLRTIPRGTEAVQLSKRLTSSGSGHRFSSHRSPMATSETTAAAKTVKNMVGAGKPLQYPTNTIAMLKVKKVPAMTLGCRLVSSRSTNWSTISRFILGVPESGRRCPLYTGAIKKHRPMAQPILRCTTLVF